MDTAELCRELIVLRDLESDLELRLKTLKPRVAAAEQAVLDEFSRTGVNTITVDNRRVGVRRMIWAGIPKEQEAEGLAALRAAGLADMVRETFSSSTLSAWVRELPEGPDGLPELPPALKDVVRIAEKMSVTVAR